MYDSIWFWLVQTNQPIGTNADKEYTHFIIFGLLCGGVTLYAYDYLNYLI